VRVMDLQEEEQLDWRERRMALTFLCQQLLSVYAYMYIRSFMYVCTHHIHIHTHTLTHTHILKKYKYYEPDTN